jgi:hypothetical protein
MPLLTDVATFLASRGVGTVGTTIWTGQMPDTCNAGVVLSEYGGAPPDFTLDDAGVHLEWPRFQAMVRHTDYVTGRALIESVYEILATVVNQTLVATKFLRIEPVQAPFPDKPPQDAQGRWVWFCNFQAMKALG